MSLTPSQLPDEALIGSAVEYLNNIPVTYRGHVCIVTLRLLASLRAMHAGNGEMLMALAQLESLLNPALAQAVSTPAVTSMFVAPPASSLTNASRI